ncbi:dehydrogenase-like protein [Saccharomonospora azurea SZMC 14600]|uniref:Gfo/Idh/MocA family protein n=1 Tax=Saccharomonospora azurea TaxID=40988 RepID=UPI0002400615|nr:Gfo/Idh/MocA family oxidoreductase [Saccharomonospora azurea]EHK85626.1 dehydrogenase-like protein [Saccharomonospora azurea SZMC 14600]
MTTSGAPLRMGVIGIGIIGRRHVQRLLSGAAAAELVAVADTDTEAATAVAAEHGTEAAGSVAELLARPDVDAVVVAVPSGLHAEVAVAALDAGKHVLLEKPIEVTVAGADEIRAAEARSRKTLSVVSQRRFAAENRFLHHAIREGALGRVTAATVEVALWRSQEYFDSGAWRGTWKLDGGGALMNQGVHLVDLALWLLGDVEEVYAHTGLLAHERIEVEDTVTVTARTRDSALLTFLATTTAYGEIPIRMAIMGDGGSVVTESERITHYTSRTHPELPELPEVDQQLAQLTDFVTAVRGGTTPLVTSAQARAAVAFIESVYTSGRTGRPVRPATITAPAER